MLTSIAIAVLVIVVLGYLFGPRRGEELIARRPYNNRYNAASGAREDHLG